MPSWPNWQRHGVEGADGPGSSPGEGTHADEAQQVEQPSCKRQDAGSSPAVGSGLASAARQVVRRPRKAERVGSSPTVGSFKQFQAVVARVVRASL